MILKEMFESQRKLDNHIAKNHDNELTFEDKIVAFVVELSEAANEIRWFKKWSNKGPSSKEIILEELVDGIHFMLSMGNDLYADIIYADMIYNHDYVADMKMGDFSEDFINIINLVSDLKTLKDMYKSSSLLDAYIELMEKYIGFICKLGFSYKDIELSYYKKQAINYNRQATGY